MSQLLHTITSHHIMTMTVSLFSVWGFWMLINPEENISSPLADDNLAATPGRSGRRKLGSHRSAWASPLTFPFGLWGSPLHPKSPAHGGDQSLCRAGLGKVTAQGVGVGAG